MSTGGVGRRKRNLKRKTRALAGRGERNNNRLSLDDFAGVWVTAKPGFGNKYRNKSDTVDLMVLRIRKGGRGSDNITSHTGSGKSNGLKKITSASSHRVKFRAI